MSRPPLFPRDAVPWPPHDVSRLRAATLSAAASGAATGVLLRLVRLAVLQREAGLPLFVAAWVLGIAVLCGMLTLHLANFPVRRWAPRVVAFWLAEAAAEIAVSALLVAAGVEPLGSSARAHFHDLPDMAATTLLRRGLILGAFALVLAAVVQVVRRRLPRHPAEGAP